MVMVSLLYWPSSNDVYSEVVTIHNYQNSLKTGDCLGRSRSLSENSSSGNKFRKAFCLLSTMGKLSYSSDSLSSCRGFMEGSP
jgi:hypothetical protein